MRKHLLVPLFLSLSIALHVSAQQTDSLNPQWRRIAGTGRAFLIPPPRPLSISPANLALAHSSIRTYPPNRPNPRRNFGPFHTGSHIDAIKILLNAPTAPTWYFTDYLTQHTNSKISSYFPSGFTPLSTVPSGTPPHHVPGNVPAADGVGDLELSMQELSYSGRYGGSVRMTFVADETFEYDARSGSVAWDFRDLTIRVYVVPAAARFNANPNTVGGEALFLEVEPAVLATYQIGANGRIIGVDTTDRSVALNALWTALASQIASQSGLAFRRAASAFVYGYIHDLFSDRLTGSNVVRELQLDEGFLDPIVETGTPYVYAAFRMSALELPDVGNDWELYLSGCLVDAATQESYCDARRQELNGRSSTSYWISAVFALSDCNQNTNVMFAADIREIDMVFDDRYSTGQQYRAVDCAVLQTLASQQRWGSTDIYRVENVPFRNPNGRLSGLASFEIKMSLENR